MGLTAVASGPLRNERRGNGWVVDGRKRRGEGQENRYIRALRRYTSKASCHWVRILFKRASLAATNKVINYIVTELQQNSMRLTAVI